uniref:KOW domain-containing protein n=1 Tax=Zea mays TaxID=4577 RepID=B6UAZ3_MAIZE|nr:hypothetical protein [Zea mays]
MAGMASLQGAMASLSISALGAATASSSSFWGNRLATYSAPQPGVRFMVKICPIEMRLKRWERKKCKPNSLPVLHKMHVRIGDTVQVIAGREKGKVGEVTRQKVDLENLRLAKLTNFKGHRNEMQLVAFLLRQSSSLKKLFLIAPKEDHPQGLRKVQSDMLPDFLKKEISHLERPSANTQIFFGEPDAQTHPLHSEVFVRF